MQKIPKNSKIMVIFEYLTLKNSFQTFAKM